LGLLENLEGVSTLCVEGKTSDSECGDESVKNDRKMG